MTPDTLTVEALQRGLDTKVIGRGILVFDSIDSTNRKARELAESGAPDGTVVVAEHQSAGRGRLDRRWFAPPGSSILCSIIVRPYLQQDLLFRLTMLASIAACDGIYDVTGVRSGIKWPNDIYVDKKKLCGILTEVDTTAGSIRHAVIGIGINVNWSPAGTELANIATSLQDVAGHEVSRVDLLQRLLQHIDSLYARLGNAEMIRRQWQLRCLHLGSTVRVDCGGSMHEGIASGITDSGSLILQTPDEVREIICGDVTLRW